MAPGTGILASLVAGALSYYGIFADRFTSAVRFAVLWVAVFALALAAVARTRRSLPSLTLILVAAGLSEPTSEHPRKRTRKTFAGRRLIDDTVPRGC